MKSKKFAISGIVLKRGKANLLKYLNGLLPLPSISSKVVVVAIRESPLPFLNILSPFNKGSQGVLPHFY
ncbi:MAG: hypothetical protein ACE5HI_09210 [bacterium]